MDNLYIVMPAYNEQDNITDVVKSWYPLLSFGGKNSKLVIADSGSSDKTNEILLGMKEQFPQLEILSNTNRYHGPKVIALYKHAIDNGADFIFQTDSDGQTNPSEFEAFWNDRNNFDGIFGHRKVRGDGKDRAFVEHVVCFLLRLYFGVKVPDANAPFRLMRASTVAKYLSRLPVDYNLPNIMLTTFFAHYKERITFRVITFKPRQAGVNSVNIPRIIKIGIKAVGDFMTFKKSMKKA